MRALAVAGFGELYKAMLIIDHDVEIALHGITDSSRDLGSIARADFSRVDRGGLKVQMCCAPTRKLTGTGGKPPTGVPECRMLRMGRRRHKTLGDNCIR